MVTNITVGDGELIFHYTYRNKPDIGCQSMYIHVCLCVLVCACVCMYVSVYTAYLGIPLNCGVITSFIRFIDPTLGLFQDWLQNTSVIA